jgi:hypothetical protein
MIRHDGNEYQWERRESVPLEALSGENKPDIKEFIAFCREGAFEIR